MKKVLKKYLKYHKVSCGKFKKFKKGNWNMKSKNKTILNRIVSIGMGLVIVTELVSAYKGKVGLKIPGDLQGASFVFDLPIKR